MPKISDKDFLENMEEYQNLVFSICMSYAKNVFDAEDLAQETFLAAYKKRFSYSGGSFKAWITMIAANKCRDFLRVRRENASLDDYEIEDKEGSVEKTVTEHLRQEEIYKMCLRLKEPYKTVVIKYFIEDMKLSEYQKESGEKLKTLQTRLYRAKQLLKRMLKEENNEAYK